MESVPPEWAKAETATDRNSSVANAIFFMWILLGTLAAGQQLRTARDAGQPPPVDELPARVSLSFAGRLPAAPLAVLAYTA